MSHVNRLSSFVFVSALIASLTLVTAPARAVTTTFNQVSWGDGNGGYIDQNSQWGEATVSFTGADAGSLTSDGAGGYFGYVNVVTSVGGGSNNNWAVQNVPMYFNSLSDLNGGELPSTVQFDLGQTDGTAVSSLNYSLTLTSAPLALQPGGPLTGAAVAAATEVDGTEGDPSEMGSEAGQPASDTLGAAAGTGIGRRGTISGSETNVPKIAESNNGCAPGSAARSLVYLSRVNPSIVITQTPQQVYGTLTNYMGTTKNGTSGAGMIAGKNSYFATNGLSIAPTVFTNGAGYLTGAINTLNATGDVEVGITWGYTVQGGTNYYYGGHAAFVSSITANTNAAGQVVSYTIRYIEDTAQNGVTATNNVRFLTVSPNGLDVNTPVGVTNRGVTGFFLENVVQVPEPSSVAMAVLGFGAIGLPLFFIRRPKRKRS